MGNGLRQRTDHSGKNVFDLSEKLQRSVFGSAFQEEGDSLLNQAFAKGECTGDNRVRFFLIRAWRSPLGNKEALAREGAEARRFPADSRANKSINPVVREREPLENPLHIGVESHGK